MDIQNDDAALLAEYIATFDKFDDLWARSMSPQLIARTELDVELGAAKIELMEPSRPDSPIAKFLERNPTGGIHHFCLGVDDVEKAAHAFAQNGVRVLGGGKPQRNVAGGPIAFLHPGDFLGALVELEEHKG